MAGQAALERPVDHPQQDQLREHTDGNAEEIDDFESQPVLVRELVDAEALSDRFAAT